MDNNYMLTVLTACLSQHYDETSQPACQSNLRCAYPDMHMNVVIGLGGQKLSAMTLLQQNNLAFRSLPITKS